MTEQTPPRPKQTKIDSAQFLGPPIQEKKQEALQIESLIVVVKFKGSPTIALDLLDENYTAEETQSMMSDLPALLLHTFRQLKENG